MPQYCKIGQAVKCIASDGEVIPWESIGGLGLGHMDIYFTIMCSYMVLQYLVYKTIEILYFVRSFWATYRSTFTGHWLG